MPGDKKIYIIITLLAFSHYLRSAQYATNTVKGVGNYKEMFFLVTLVYHIIACD